jgi:hypothetical protein
MKSISKQQTKVMAGLIEDLRARQSAVHEAFLALDEACSNYNLAADEMNNLLREIHDDMESYYNDRSEKWQESEKGEAYLSWMNEWDRAVEEVEAEEPAVNESDVDELDGLPEEPDFS